MIVCPAKKAAGLHHGSKETKNITFIYKYY